MLSWFKIEQKNQNYLSEQIKCTQSLNKDFQKKLK